MFAPFQLYTHNRMLDAAIYVLKRWRLPSGDYSLKVKWMNRRGLDLGATEVVRICKEEVKNWSMCVSKS